MKRYDTLQAGRAIAAVAVVFYHLHQIFAQYFGSEVGRVFAQANAGVQYFFVLSGVVVTLAHRRELGRAGDPRPFFLKRLARLVPALWVVLLLTLPYYALQGRRPSLGDLAVSFGILPTNGLPPMLSVEWSLQHELLFYGVFGLFLWRPLLGGTLGFLWIGASLMGVIAMRTYPASFLFSPNHALFALGVGVALALLRGATRGARAYVVAGALLMAATYALGLRLENRADAPDLRVVYGIASALLIWGLAVLETRGALRVPRPLAALGDASYSLYLLHYPLLSATAKLLAARHVDRVVGLAGCWAICLAVVIAASLVFHRLVEAPLVARVLDRLRGLLPASASTSTPASAPLIEARTAT